ncbi:MAG: hypothetical protein MZW92_61400 [Comamonadaceae bacterium]|nr:hypothetical protein [Comamonadaceae bacterium]
MGTKKLLAALFLPLLLVSFLQSQSLADLAKKEKERRAALKGKHAAVVTTKDLAKSTRRPAVESAEQEQAAEEVAVEAGEAGAQAGQEGAAPPAAGSRPAEAAAEPEKTAAETEKPAPTAQDIQKKQAELADLAQQKAEMVDLLTLKMNTLYQEFYSLDSLKSREMIQVQISDTYDKLLKAETESAKAQKDLEDFVAQTSKAKAPAIWIK